MVRPHLGLTGHAYSMVIVGNLEPHGDTTPAAAALPISTLSALDSLDLGSTRVRLATLPTRGSLHGVFPFLFLILKCIIFGYTPQ